MWTGSRRRNAPNDGTQYQHYSGCRQASFTYRKAKRFREFLNLPPQLDLKSSDTVNIAGFLAFEMVRTLTLAGLAMKQSSDEAHFSNDYASARLGNESPTQRVPAPRSADAKALHMATRNTHFLSILYLFRL